MFTCDAVVELPSGLAHNVDEDHVPPSGLGPRLDYAVVVVVACAEHDYDAAQQVHDALQHTQRVWLLDGVLDEHEQSCIQKLKVRLAKRQ
jgi:hypothetical protein